jgi:thioredoxin reductase
MEAAASIAEQENTSVTLSYRNEAFSRAKPTNRRRVDEAKAAGRLKILMKSQVKQIGQESAQLEWNGRPIEIPNDAVIVCAGGTLPTQFLQSMGIEVETKYGTA